MISGNKCCCCWQLTLKQMNSITGQRGLTHMYIYGWNVPLISDRSQDNFKQIHFQKLEVFTFQIKFHTHCYEPFHLDKHITYKGVDVNQPLNCKWVTGSLMDADRSGFSLKSELKCLLWVKLASDRCGLEGWCSYKPEPLKQKPFVHRCALLSLYMYMEIVEFTLNWSHYCELSLKLPHSCLQRQQLWVLK